MYVGVKSVNRKTKRKETNYNSHLKKIKLKLKVTSISYIPNQKSFKSQIINPLIATKNYLQNLVKNKLMSITKNSKQD